MASITPPSAPTAPSATHPGPAPAQPSDQSQIAHSIRPDGRLCVFYLLEPGDDASPSTHARRVTDRLLGRLRAAGLVAGASEEAVRARVRVFLGSEGEKCEPPQLFGRAEGIPARYHPNRLQQLLDGNEVALLATVGAGSICWRAHLETVGEQLARTGAPFLCMNQQPDKGYDTFIDSAELVSLTTRLLRRCPVDPTLAMTAFLGQMVELAKAHEGLKHGTPAERAVGLCVLVEMSQLSRLAWRYDDERRYGPGNFRDDLSDSSASSLSSSWTTTTQSGQA